MAESLLLTYLGDKRFCYALPRAITLQILLPPNASSLVEFAKPNLWAHKSRAVSQFVNMTYAGRDMASVMVHAHEHVRGTDSTGHNYHSLRPSIFHFQHATNVDALFTSIELFARPLTSQEKDQLYAECCEWYQMYGISDRDMPPTYADFVDYFDTFCAERLTMSPDAEQLRDQALAPHLWLPSRVPQGAIRAMLHPRAQELLGATASAKDQVSLDIFASRVRARMAVTPRRQRLIPPARTVASRVGAAAS